MTSALRALEAPDLLAQLMEEEEGRIGQTAAYMMTSETPGTKQTSDLEKKLDEQLSKAGEEILRQLATSLFSGGMG